MPPILTTQRYAYAAFVGFCILSSSRDVLSELFFKDSNYGVSPEFTLLIYSIVTQAVALLVQLLHGERPFGLRGPWNFKWQIFVLNVATMVAFLTYFLAIRSPVGAGLNAFVDYGLAPAFTAIIGVIILGDRLDRWFWFSGVVALLGLGLLAVPRIASDQLSAPWMLGILLAVVSSASSAVYRVYFKVLTLAGVSPGAIVFNRLHGTTLILGAFAIWRPEIIRLDVLLQTALIGLVGFCAPLFLMLAVIRRVSIPQFAILLFAFPLLTLLFSAATGYTHLFWSDLLAGALILLALAFNERISSLGFWSRFRGERRGSTS